MSLFFVFIYNSMWKRLSSKHAEVSCYCIKNALIKKSAFEHDMSNFYDDPVFCLKRAALLSLNVEIIGQELHDLL